MRERCADIAPLVRTMRGGNRQFCSSLRDIAQLSAICNVRYEPIGSASTTDSRRALYAIQKIFF